MPSLNDLPLDHQHALRTASANLAKEFASTFGRETIEQFLTTSWDEFADDRAVIRFEPA
ncbi:MAG: three-helix bundle dimerization domain-containing protein [Acidimicrobiales bacterium]